MFTTIALPVISDSDVAEPSAEVNETSATDAEGLDAPPHALATARAATARTVTAPSRGMAANA
jgi:hypothetical protein